MGQPVFALYANRKNERIKRISASISLTIGSVSYSLVWAAYIKQILKYANEVSYSFCGQILLSQDIISQTYLSLEDYNMFLRNNFIILQRKAFLPIQEVQTMFIKCVNLNSLKKKINV